ncbi:MAG: amidohydrolase family protein [Actinomycetota bacterium]|nr:amidohydrolase family protein [Actinomycetota bacterium]
MDEGSMGEAGTGSGLLIRGGSVVDGTGSRAYPADVRVRAGRIVEVAPSLRPDGEEELDAGGAVVTPGFIDTHAHVDAQVFWDPALDPEPLHGVTTLLTGNCSLSLYPVSDSTRAEISDLFAYIEDVPRHLFDDSVPWEWSDFAGYAAAVNRTGTGANLAPLVGHSMIRLSVMGPDAWTRTATEAETAQMAAVLGEAMTGGAWGLSTSHLDVDSTGRPVPSRQAGEAEVDALLDTIGGFGRGLVEIVPALLDNEGQYDKMEHLARRCARRGLPLTWTGFAVSERDPQFVTRWLDLARRLQDESVPFYPQLSPRTVDFRLNWDSSMMFMSLAQGWHKVVAARGPEAKAALLSDPAWRDTARAEWDRVERALFPHRRPEKVRFVEVFGADQEPWRGRTLAELVAEKGGHPSDVLADFVLANQCRPGLVAQGVANADVEAVARVLTDPTVLISSSDAGAHMQMLCASGDSTLLLTRHVRERGDLTLEEAVHALTGRQADVFGFRGRGRIEAGAVADLAVFDLDELHYDEDGFVDDLPGGGARLRRAEGGYRATFVAGRAVQSEGKLTGALPGRVISSAEA